MRISSRTSTKLSASSSDIDETVSLDGTQSTDFWSRRAVHFNKYAVYATKARVYQAMGNSAKAAEYAKKVTDHTASFKLAGRNSFESVRPLPLLRAS